MANILSGSKWFRKSRINVDTDLQFDGIDQVVTAFLDSKFDFGPQDFAISFLTDLKTLSPDTFISLRNNSSPVTLFELRASSTNELAIFWQNSGAGSITTFTYYFNPISQLDDKMHIVTQRSGLNLDIYVNSVKLIQKTGTTLGLTSDKFSFNAGDLNIGASTSDGINSINANISNVSIFNTSLSESQISYIHVNGGIVPQDLHEKCLANYPLQNICTVDASIFTIDSIEQYNYEKTDLIKQFGLFPPLGYGAIGYTGDGANSGSTYLLSWAATLLGEKKITRNYKGTNLKSIVLGVVNLSTATDARIDVIRNSDSAVLQTLDLSLGDVTFDISINSDETDYSVEIVGDHHTDDGNNQILQFRQYNTNESYFANNGTPVNFADASSGTFNKNTLKDFYNKYPARKTGYSNKFTDSIDWSNAVNYEFYKYDKGSPIFSSSSDWSLIITNRYTGNFGANFGVVGAKNSMFTTGSIITGIGMLSYYENTNRVIFDVGTISYDWDAPDKLPIFSDTLTPSIFIVTNDSSTQELTITLADGASGRKQSKVFDTSADSWNSNNDIRIFADKGQPIITDVIVADSIITDSIQDDIIGYNFDNITNKFLHWKFNETTDTLKVKDLSGNARDGSLYVNNTTPALITTAHKTPILDIDSNLPILKNSLYFDNVEDQYLESQQDFEIPFDENGQYTIQVVLKPIDTWPTSADDGYPFAFYNTTSTTASFGMQLGNDPVNFSIFYDDPSEGQKTVIISNANTPVPENTLMILSILVDNSNTGFGGRFGSQASDSLQIYIDGIHRPASASSSLAKLRFDLLSPTRSNFGHNSFKSLTLPGWNGYLISFDVYNKALSDKELLELSNNTLMKRPSISQFGNNLKFSLDFQRPVFDSSVGDYVFEDKIYGHQWKVKNWPNLQSIENSTISICEIRDETGGNSPITQTYIWGDELDQPIVTEKDDYIEVPPTP